MKKYGKNLRHKKQYPIYCEDCGVFLYTVEQFYNGMGATCGECNGTGEVQLETYF